MISGAHGIIRKTVIETITWERSLLLAYAKKTCYLRMTDQPAEVTCKRKTEYISKQMEKRRYYLNESSEKALSTCKLPCYPE